MSEPDVCKRPALHLSESFWISGGQRSRLGVTIHPDDEEDFLGMFLSSIEVENIEKKKQLLEELKEIRDKQDEMDDSERVYVCHLWGAVVMKDEHLVRSLNHRIKIEMNEREVWI